MNFQFVSTDFCLIVTRISLCHIGYIDLKNFEILTKAESFTNSKRDFNSRPSEFEFNMVLGLAESNF